MKELQLHRVRLPLVSPFRTAYGIQTVKDVLLVKAVADEAEGWGECVAMSFPGYSSEYTDAAALVIKAHLAPLILAADDLSGSDITERLSSVIGHNMAKTALEMAVLDAELRASGQSFGSWIGSVTDRVPAGVSTGIAASITELVQTVGGYLDDGYRRVKIKIQPGWDIEPVAVLRRELGEDFVLQVDGNGAYSSGSSGELDHLAQLDRFALAMIEQPFAPADLLGHARLARQISTPICLDESVSSPSTAETALALGACSVINVKAGRVGGYGEARRIHDLCRERGVAVWCGGMLETGLGRAANVALAALPNFTLPGDLSASERYFSQDITEPWRLVDGHLTVPDGPGFGVEIKADILESLTTSVEYLSRP